MTPQQLSKDIQAGKFASAYYFYGTEQYRIVEAVKFIAGQFLPSKLVSTNFRRIDGKRTPVGELLAELAAYPMLGERQVFAVSDFQHYKPKDVERVLKMISPDDAARIVIMTSPADKKPKWDSAFLKAVKNVAIDVEFKKLTDDEIQAVIRNKMTKAGKEIASDAVAALSELVAGDRGALETECEKLLDYRAGEKDVTLAHVRAVAAGVQFGSVLEIGDCVVRGNTRQILEQFRFLIADGTTPTGLVYFLGQHYMTLYQIKNGRPLEPWRKWLTANYRKQADLYDNQQLEDIIVQLAETDGKMRRYGVKPDILLEMMVLNLVGSRRARG
ncbi:MAG: DNA polymerase III subunit delta [Candidatus Zixiibacteriota bacterium]